MWHRKEIFFPVSGFPFLERCAMIQANTGRNEVSRRLDRDNEWIRTLYLQLYEKLFRAAYRLMGSSESAEDLVQQTFLLALFQGEALRAHPCPEGWLMKALHNLAMNERRRAARRQEVPLDALFDQAAEADSPPLAESLPRRLSPQDREVLLWRFEQGLDYDEIAERLGISEAGGRSRVSRAVRRCRELWDGDPRRSDPKQT